ncbi:MAG: ATP-binding cassette domain-containing protein [Methanobacterium sp.]
MNEAEKENNIVELNEVWKIYKNGDKIIHALSRINCVFEKGSFNIIQGPSGCGKSTMIRMIGLLETPTMGKVLMKGENTSDLSQNKRNSIIRDEIGVVFKSSNLIPIINAVDNLTLPMLHSDNYKAKKLLKKVGFNDYSKFPNEMSVEEEQRVCIARAMVNNHSIILLDEPTGDLHTKESDNIIELLLDLNQSEGLTMILTTNNQRLSNFDQKVVEMVDGTIFQNE